MTFIIVNFIFVLGETVNYHLKDNQHYSEDIF